jgi:MFS family permease
VANKYNKKNMITVILLFLAFLFALLGISQWFVNIMVISFGIALGLALLRPIISWLVSEFVNPKDIWTISGVQWFSAMLGDIAWVIWFGIISSFIWVETTFVLIWIGLFAIGWYFAFQKIKSMYAKN